MSMSDLIIIFLIVITGTWGIIAGGIIFLQWASVTFFNNVPSKVYVDGNLVYEGISAGFDVTSGGYTTTVTIKGGFLYFFPQKVYTSKDVTVEGEKQ